MASFLRSKPLQPNATPISLATPGLRGAPEAKKGLPGLEGPPEAQILEAHPCDDPSLVAALFIYICTYLSPGGLSRLACYRLMGIHLGMKHVAPA